MNLIQQALYEYIIDKDYNDKMLQYNALLDYLFEDLLIEDDGIKATDKTKIQEILTCIFFDGCINSDSEKLDVNTVVSSDYLNNLDFNKISEISKLNLDEKTCKKVFQNFLTDKKYKSWKESFKCQCNSIKKWFDASKKFKSKKYKFIHHDTKFSICKKNIFLDNTNICDLATPTSGDKDAYQKADIYMVENDFILDSKRPKNDAAAIEYWKKGINKGNFIGISLKQLKSNANPYIWEKGESEKNLVVDRTYSSIVFPILSSNKVTTEFRFGIVDTKSNEKHLYKFSIRSNAHSIDNHYLEPYIFLNVSTTIELGNSTFDKNAAADNYTKASSNAQLGKAQTLLTKWIDNAFNTAEANANKTILDVDKFNEYLNDIKTNLVTLGISKKSDIGKQFEINPNQAKIIEEISENYNYIESFFLQFKNIKEINNIDIKDIISLGNEKNYKKYENNINALGLSNITDSESLKEILKNLCEKVKWYNVIKNIIIDWWVITNKMVSNIDNISDSADNTLKELFVYCKDCTLPYLMLG